MLEKNNQIIIYNTEDGKTEIEVSLEDETIWLNQKQMSELFQTTVANINQHAGNILKEGELEEISTIKKSLIVQKEGSRNVSREIEYYNLETIISLGYKINSDRAADFRRWATRVLKDYAEKGIPMTMKDWSEKLNVFLRFNKEDVLGNAGKVTAEIAKAFAESEFEKYRPIQDRLYESDFDKEIKKYLKEKNN